VTPKRSIAKTVVRPINKKNDVSPLAPTVLQARNNASKTQMASRPSDKVREAVRRPSNLEINKAIGNRTMRAMRLNNNVSKKSSRRAFGLWLAIVLMICGGAGAYAWTHKAHFSKLTNKTTFVQKAELQAPKLKQKVPAAPKTKITKERRRSTAI
jgi:hypothetical protein